MEENYRLERYGQTGDPEKDGILTPDQQELLNKIQSDAADALFNHLENRKEGDLFPMAVMATGIGKTRVEHLLIERTKRKDPNAKVLFIAGTKLTLVDQSGRALSDYQGSYGFGSDDSSLAKTTDYIESEDSDSAILEEDLDEIIREEQEDLGIYSVGRFPINPEADVQVGVAQGVQSMFRRGLLNHDDFQLVIPDEAHNLGTENRTEMMKGFKNVAGLTATSHRSSGRMRSPESYGFEVVYQITLPEAQEKELLPPLIETQLNTAELVDEIPMRRNGEIDFKKLEKLLKENYDLRPYIADRVAEIITKDGKKFKTVIATNFVWEAEELAKLLYEKGIKVGVAVNEQAARSIHSDEIPAVGSIDRYKLKGDDPDSIQVLISPYVASEGFDAPATEVLVWASPTDSAVRYTQYTGRLARRAPGKAFGHVIDCLYQTSQYGWSYNFAMWMKGNVKQLGDGVLYLGPQRKIETIKNLPTVNSIGAHINNNDKVSLDNLQIGGLEEVKETDFPINNTFLASKFIGTAHKLRPIADEVFEEVKKSNPEMTDRRKNGKWVVDVLTEPSLFLQKMQERGVELSDSSIGQINNNEFLVSAKSLRSVFEGTATRLLSASREVLQELEKTNPELIARRKSGSNYVIILKDTNLFNQKMLNRGIVFRDSNLTEMVETDFPITSTFLQKIFVGDYKLYAPIVREIMQEIEKTSPELIVKKKSGVKTVRIITNPDIFIQKMKDRGIGLKDLTIEEVKDTDFRITTPFLRANFVGEYSRFLPIVNQVIAEIKESHPELIKIKRNGPSDITVVEDSDLFIQKMSEKGVKLKDKKS